MPKLTQAAVDKANAVARDYNAKMQAITNDATLTPFGKQQAMARTHTQLAPQMQKIREEWLGQAQQTTTKANRALFGNERVSGADAISVRDASDRAARLESPREALDLYSRAVNNGDDHLARAVVQHAYDQANLLSIFSDDHGWVEVLHAHADQTPGFADRLTEIADAEHQAADEALNEMHFALIKPTPIARLTDSQLAAVVDDDPVPA